MLNLIKKATISLQLAMMLLLLGCTQDTQIIHKSVRPSIFDTTLYGIKVGETTENEIRKEFRVLKSYGRLLYLDPEDPHFKNLPIEKAIVLLTEARIVESFNVSYKPQKIYGR